MVTVYSQPHCAPCYKVKTWMRLHDVEYTEKNIVENPDALAELQEKGFSSTPVIVTDTDAWAGIDLAKMKALVA